MSAAAFHFIAWALAHGWRVWAEYHPYFADHARGGWIEWLARRA